MKKQPSSLFLSEYSIARASALMLYIACDRCPWRAWSPKVAMLLFAAGAHSRYHFEQQRERSA